MRHPLHLGSQLPTANSSHDDPRLDNPVYEALSGTHARFAQRNGRALRYDPEVAPFLAVPSDASAADWRDAVELMPPGTMAGILHDGSALPESVEVADGFELVQMIGADVVGCADPEVATLGPADVPEMLELVELTQPGPFLTRTIELGRYVGIRRDGSLAAMAGERLRFQGWTEISAVCTAPAHRGQGLASRLMATLVADIQRRSEGVFLHVLRNNTGAIRLYKELGFRARGGGVISVLARPGAD